MSKVTQRAGVYAIISSIHPFEDGEVVTLTTEERKQVAEEVALQLHNGDIEFSEKAKDKYSTVEDIRKKYAPGLISNWLRKDTRMNGNTKYEAKNPGSRAGQGDARLKAMRGLMKQFQAANAPADKVETLQAAIDTRTAELATEKAKKVEIDISQLSPELMEALGLETPEVAEVELDIEEVQEA